MHTALYPGLQCSSSLAAPPGFKIDGSEEGCEFKKDASVRAFNEALESGVKREVEANRLTASQELAISYDSVEAGNCAAL